MRTLAALGVWLALCGFRGGGLPAVQAPVSEAYRSLVIADGAVLYFRLDELAGNPVSEVGSFTTGVSSSPTPPTRGVAGAISGSASLAWTFPGTASIDVDDSAVFDVTDFSLEAWVSTSDAGSGRRRIINHQCDGGTYILMALNGNVLEFGSSNDGVLATKGSALNNGAYRHLVVVRDTVNDVLTWYVDGVSIGTQASANNSGYAIAGRFNVAALNPGSGCLGFLERITGTIDEPVLYNVALTATQVLNHYNCGATGACP